MPAKDNLTKMANIGTSLRDIDFVTRFEMNWEALATILGITRPIKKENGSQLTVKKGAIVLQNGSNIGEGEEIPYSLASVIEETIGDITIEKWAKATSIEAIAKHGYEYAVEKTDDAFLNELQGNVTDRMFNFLKSGELTAKETTFQMAVAMAKGYVVDKFKNMGLTSTEIVGFVSGLDAYQYLGAANVTVQTAFGMDYVENFMGYRIMFLMGTNQIPRNTVIAIPRENLIAYYVDPADSEFAQAGLPYATAGETPFLGFHTQGDYKTAVSEAFAIMGLQLLAEYIDGIAVVTVEASGSLGSATVTSAAGTAVGDSAVTVTYALGTGERAYYIESSAAITYTYLDSVDLTGYTALPFTSGTAQQISGLTSGKKLNVLIVNGAGQAVASGNATVAVKS